MGSNTGYLLKSFLPYAAQDQMSLPLNKLPFFWYKEIIALVDNDAHTNCNGKTCTVENKYYKPDEGHKVTLKYRVIYQSKPKPQVTRLTRDGIEICAMENLECIESDKYLLIKCDQQRSHIISNNGIHSGRP